MNKLLPEAYRIGNGNPWDGYLEIKAATEKPISGARDLAAVLRKRIRDIPPLAAPKRQIPKNDEWMY